VVYAIASNAGCRKNKQTNIQLSTICLQMKTIWKNALIFSDYHGNSLDRQNSIPVWYKIRNDIPRIV
jgi:hypothetical protein